VPEESILLYPIGLLMGPARVCCIIEPYRCTKDWLFDGFFRTATKIIVHQFTAVCDNDKK
jgi:hypothetical protein